MREAFAANFANDLEVGACFTAAVAGKTVVDLWGGFRDARRTRPWERDTIVCVWSTTKVMTAACAWMLAARGALDLDAPVARYWPEFAAAGKEELPVRFLLSHSSGLAGWEQPIEMSDLYDWERSTALLAAQKPWWEPGTASGYHALTFGHLIGEVIRRITGRSLGRFFRDEVAAPLGADFHIGLGAEHEPRLGEMIAPAQAPDAMTDMLRRVMTNPRGWSPAVARDRGYRAAEVPGANGHGNARSVARVAAALASGGALDGVRLLPEPFFDAVIEEQIHGAGPGARPSHPVGSRRRPAVEGNAAAQPALVLLGRLGWIAVSDRSRRADRLRLRHEQDEPHHDGRPAGSRSGGRGLRVGVTGFRGARGYRGGSQFEIGASP